MQVRSKQKSPSFGGQESQYVKKQSGAEQVENVFNVARDKLCCNRHRDNTES